MKKEEINYKVKFTEKYFNKKLCDCDFDVLKEVDVLLKDKNNNHILYIESKDSIYNESDLKKALAQTILTNHKQTQILSKVALIYKDKENNDVLKLIDCSDNSIMYNNDINWREEKPSNPTKDAIDRINDRIFNKITTYYNEEIKDFFNLLIKKQDTKIDITLNNINVVYNQWKHNIEFKREVDDEQDLINLFLIDILNGTKYKQKIKDEFGEREINLIREGTDLSKYEINYNNGIVKGIVYNDRDIYTIKDIIKYNLFWNKYKRPPEQNEFLKILERSATLYSEKYRKDTGGEYTPCCFVEKQNEILQQNYNLNDFIVFDPCAGVGNLENQFGKDFKQYCYLSTLEQMDVDTMKIKNFENSIQYDYLKDDKQPKFKYQGDFLDINEICKRENKKLMVIMNPPYQKIKGFKNNLAIEFFNKVLKLEPQVIILYYMTESFLRDELNNYINSNYKIVSHIMSNAKTTFLLSEWPISLVIFDKDKGEEINKSNIQVDRYELNNKTEKLDFIKTYSYNQEKPNLIKEIEKEIKKNQDGIILGNYAFMSGTISLVNKIIEKSNYSITTNNLKYCLLHKGINFNTHIKYFERSNNVYRGKIEDIKEELFNDSIMFSLFYKNCAFSNKQNKNYIMPFTSEMLNCNKNDLNVLTNNTENNLFSADEVFDFREWLKQFNFSKEAKDLYKSALQIFLYYHKNYSNTDYNDSFYDITNTIMNKDTNNFKTLSKENDTRINKTKTTKGTIGFGRNTIKSVVNSEYLPIFFDFFDKRDVLAKKINKQLVEGGLLLWERENIY